MVVSDRTDTREAVGLHWHNLLGQWLLVQERDVE